MYLDVLVILYIWMRVNFVERNYPLVVQIFVLEGLMRWGDGGGGTGWEGLGALRVVELLFMERGMCCV